MAVPNKVQLVTYADSLGGDTKTLNTILNRFLPDMFGGIHLLSLFPSSGGVYDAPSTYFMPQQKVGGWKEVDALGKNYPLLVDINANQVSTNSEWFQSFLKQGKSSAYADCFLSIHKIWPDGSPKQWDIEKFYRHRPLPFSEYKLADGSIEKVWTTFGISNPSDQVDLDINTPTVRQWYIDIFHFLSEHGVKLIRLNALGHVIKKPSTSCFWVEPEINEFLAWMKEAAATSNIELLCEVPVETATQRKLAQEGYRLYDLMLPYTILHVLQTANSQLLYEVLQNRPHNQVTSLNFHEGILVKPFLNGLVDKTELHQVCGVCKSRGASFKIEGGDENQPTDMFSTHWLKGHYYTLLSHNDNAYIAAHAIQFFVPGLPQLPYTHLFAGMASEPNAAPENDTEKPNHYCYTANDVQAACCLPVVKRLLGLIHFRNHHNAFNGNFIASQSRNREIILGWQNGAEYCRLHLDLETMKAVIYYTDTNGEEQCTEA